jgi:hypothetical protein
MRMMSATGGLPMQPSDMKHMSNPAARMQSTGIIASGSQLGLGNKRVSELHRIQHGSFANLNAKKNME